MGRQLRPGDVVEVRSAAEILATLDGQASVEAMPFMPEMLQYVGRRFTISRSVEKVCDTVDRTYRSRRMRSTRMLGDLRCDGSGHDACQAGCRLYWKDSWLRPVGSDDAEDVPADDHGTRVRLERLVREAAKQEGRGGGPEEPIYRCQATEALAASESLGRFDVRQYVREVSSENHSTRHVVRVLLRELIAKVRRVVTRRALPLEPLEGQTSTEPLGLRAGDRVHVRSREEIAATLDARGMNRGLWFDAEMLAFSGGTYTVKARVERFIDDATGKMVCLSNDCVILEDVCCSGECSPWRWFCPRGVYPFWREAWLRRVQDPSL